MSKKATNFEELMDSTMLSDIVNDLNDVSDIIQNLLIFFAQYGYYPGEDEVEDEIIDVATEEEVKEEVEIVSHTK